MKYRFTMMSVGFLALLCACTNSEDNESLLNEAQMLIDEQLIQEYLKENNISASKSSSGLYYVIYNAGDEGTTSYPTSNSTVTLEYKGYFLDEEVFENSNDREEPFVIGLWQVIDGMKEGVQLIKKGGEIQLFIPSHLGFGSNDQGIIPANSVLIYELELVDFE